jgi:hypothetical protein
MKTLFTQTYYSCNTEKQLAYTFTTLPNGDLHSIHDRPALVSAYIVFDKLKEPIKAASQRDILTQLLASNSKHLYLKWYKNGKNHRDNDQPAVICIRVDNKQNIATKLATDLAYYNEMCCKQYQASNILCVPEVKKYCKQLTNNIVSLKWYQNNINHRDNDQPAHVAISNKYHWYHVSWYYNGIKTRSGNKSCQIDIDGLGECNKHYNISNYVIGDTDEISQWLQKYRHASTSGQIEPNPDSCLYEQSYCHMDLGYDEHGTEYLTILKHDCNRSI